MLSHTRAICAAIVAAATLIIAANAGPARAAEPQRPPEAAPSAPAESDFALHHLG
ncbi:hypothetical protein [Streptomyces sp. NPDC002156]